MDYEGPHHYVDQLQNFEQLQKIYVINCHKSFDIEIITHVNNRQIYYAEAQNKTSKQNMFFLDISDLIQGTPRYFVCR